MKDYDVRRISSTVAKEYIHVHHYSHGSHAHPSPDYGLFDGDSLIGVCMFATPCSERVRSCVFGEEHKNTVLELHRLHILDVTPKNTESWFISKVFNLLRLDRPDLRGIIAFSDTTEGHNGTIYQATNALYCGKTSKSRFYVDETGRLRHPRQCGHNVSLQEAQQLGWKPTIREAKNRYVWIIGNKSDRYHWRKQLKLKVLNYEK